ncbi:enolase C-terminal domain-like protein [Actinokineospora xionganensis]|uniref:Muconate cycloisomerase n=1 Tax=Actinokineospora xionganensis TaxID=2684470 RepID=A0ABR7L405_9PSEU|nr:enolase C-terminal domain-like protein [Actinokineospora xionganensis]MBC6447416.1 muconate cycloisomerase [Actinokineospora xionganensis]
MLRIDLYEARVPMRRAFSHATKKRTASSSVLLRLRGADADGWGEAAPREYVTGESVESVLAALAHAPLPADLIGLPLDDALAALTGLRLPEVLGARGGPAPAAAAALETALLDLLCRAHGVDGFEALVRAGFGDVLGPAPAAVPVSTVLDLSRDPVAHLAALGADTRALIPHVKLKAGAEVAAVAAMVARVRDLLPATTTVSVDANGAWALADVLAHAADLVAAGLSWVEEPLAPRRWTDLAALRRAGLTVMLDESFTGEADLAEAVDHAAADLLNLRVSKCGGPLRLLDLARRASAARLGVQVGVQVGEVGPLWAAGRLVATSLRSAVAVEAGRQDEWFEPGLTRPAYHVDRHTSSAPPLAGPGIGLEPTGELLAACVPHGSRIAEGAR